MSTAELRAQIVHRLAGVSDNGVLKAINALLDFKTTESVFQCTAEQRDAIMQAQQAIARGEGITNEEIKNTVELCLNEN